MRRLTRWLPVIAALVIALFAAGYWIGKGIAERENRADARALEGR